MNPRFSVLIPVYNRPKLVRETIDSVLAQTFTSFELVLIDDGSTDETPEVLRSYGDRIRVLNQANQGPEAARHRAAAVTTGEYFVLLDSDDLLLPRALATYDAIIRNLNAPPVIIAAISEFHTGDPIPADDGTATIAVRQYRDLFSRDRPVGKTCSQIIARRSAVEAAGAFRSSATAFPFDTADIMLSLSTHGPWVVVDQPVTVGYRLHGSNTIGNLDYMVRTAPCLYRLEKEGRYPGGSKQRWARRAYLGGVSWNWCRQALRARAFPTFCKLAFRTGPLIARGMVRKLVQRFRAPAEITRLTY